MLLTSSRGLSASSAGSWRSAWTTIWHIREEVSERRLPACFHCTRGEFPSPNIYYITTLNPETRNPPDCRDPPHTDGRTRHRQSSNHKPHYLSDSSTVRSVRQSKTQRRSLMQEFLMFYRLVFQKLHKWQKNEKNTEWNLSRYERLSILIISICVFINDNTDKWFFKIKVVIYSIIYILY